MKKIVIRVPMNCNKSRRKAMKIAAATEGVNSVLLEGEEKNQVVVMGDGVDAFCLTVKLRKNFRHVTLEGVLELEGNKKEESKPVEVELPLGCSHYPPAPCSPYYYRHVVYDIDPHPSNCSIM